MSHFRTTLATEFTIRMQGNIVSDAERDEMEKSSLPRTYTELLYLSSDAREILSIGENVLARIVESPSKAHWKAGKRIPHHYVGNPFIGITIWAVMI